MSDYVHLGISIDSGESYCTFCERSQFFIQGQLSYKSNENTHPDIWKGSHVATTPTLLSTSLRMDGLEDCFLSHS